MSQSQARCSCLSLKGSHMAATDSTEPPYTINKFYMTNLNLNALILRVLPVGCLKVDRCRVSVTVWSMFNQLLKNLEMFDNSPPSLFCLWTKRAKLVEYIWRGTNRELTEQDHRFNQWEMEMLTDQYSCNATAINGFKVSQWLEQSEASYHIQKRELKACFCST